MAKAILHVKLPKMKKDFDAILIDGPPRVYDVAKIAVLASDAAFAESIHGKTVFEMDAERWLPG